MMKFEFDKSLWEIEIGDKSYPLSKRNHVLDAKIRAVSLKGKEGEISWEDILDCFKSMIGEKAVEDVFPDKNDLDLDEVLALWTVLCGLYEKRTLETIKKYSSLNIKRPKGWDKEPQ